MPAHIAAAPDIFGACEGACEKENTAMDSGSASTSAPSHAHAGRGVATSLIASVLFAVIFLIAGLLPGWGAEEIFGWRVVLTLATLGCIFRSSPGRVPSSVTSSLKFDVGRRSFCPGYWRPVLSESSCGFSCGRR
ncbi:hypothetical protein NHF46_02255 [Arthrobacter alpinus]|nr:hypothetical protein [Arthrobacter alpinus]